MLARRRVVALNEAHDESKLTAAAVCVRALIEHQLATGAATAAESMLAIRENKSRSLQDANKFTDQLLFE